MHRGKRKDGSDAFAEQLYPADYWPLEMLILITSEAQSPSAPPGNESHRGNIALF
ncbi:MAG: hypothetical protein R3C26_11315 [Calditrichia bacterium]